jgi:SAM-dependent methyltransferase
MASDLLDTWNDLAHHWDDWGPPLRPAAEDLAIMRRALTGWRPQDGAEAARVFLCGVTPEIVEMPWPFPVELVGMDQAESMVRVVWPGDVPGVRRGLVGDWRRPGLPPASQDVVVGDGGFVFFDFPNGQRELLSALRKLLKPGGILVFRLYSQLRQRESLAEVIDAARAGRMGNFHVFNFRGAMALQEDAAAGARLHDVWQACTEADIDPRKLPQPGWSPSAVDTIRFYRHKDSRLYFPTLDEFMGLANGVFDEVQIEFPTYEMGDRCPILTAR